MKFPTNKFKIIGFSVIFVISILILVVDFLEKFKAGDLYPMFTGFLAILGALVAYIQYLGKYSTFLFFGFNKIYRLWMVNTVSWESKYKFYADNVKTVDDFKKLKITYIDWLEKENYFKIEKKFADTEDTLKLSIKYRGRERNIKLSYFQGPQPYITYNFTSSLAYKDSLEEFTVFENFLKELEKSITNDSTITRNNQYQVEISLEKWNPFYKVVLTQFDNKHIQGYELIINDVDSENNEGKIVIKPKSIIINSKSNNFMKEAVKDYLILSSTD